MIPRSFIALFAACTLSTSFAETFELEEWPSDAPYNKVFDPWRACIHAEDMAKRAHPDALRTIFLAAYVRLNQPFLGGEDLEHMHMIFANVYSSVGDKRFVAALKKQPPEIRSAVRRFLTAPKRSETKEILTEAPEIDWPLDKAYRADN